MAFNVTDAIAPGLSMVGNVVSSITQNKAVKKQIKYQREENERNRQYNKQLAEWQNAENLKQWERENAYNTPAAMMQRLKQAGLNPDLMYQNGAGNLASASSPEMTSGASSQPTDYSAMGRIRSTFGEALNSAQSSYYQAKQAEANIELAESQANKNNSEARGTDLQNTWIDKLNGNTLNIGNATIRNLDVSSNLGEAQKEKIGAEIQQIHTAIDNLRESTELVKSKVGDIQFSQAIRRMEYDLRSKLTHAQLSKIATENGLTIQRTIEIRDKLPVMIGLMAAQNMDANAGAMLKQQQRYNEQLKSLGIQITNEGLVLDNDVRRHRSGNAKAYDNSTDSLGIIGSTIRVATQLIQDVFGGSIGSLMK